MTIAAAWADFERKVIVRDLTSRMMFYAGAAALFDAITRVAEDGDDAMLNTMLALAVELDAFTDACLMTLAAKGRS